MNWEFVALMTHLGKLLGKCVVIAMAVYRWTALTACQVLTVSIALTTGLIVQAAHG